MCLNRSSFFAYRYTHRRIGGVQEEVIDEGTHIAIPWFERPIIYDVRTRPRNIPSVTGSRDMQQVQITVRVLSKPGLLSFVRFSIGLFIALAWLFLIEIKMILPASVP